MNIFVGADAETRSRAEGGGRLAHIYYRAHEWIWKLPGTEECMIYEIVSG
jgi:hypothetical protein